MSFTCVNCGLPNGSVVDVKFATSVLAGTRDEHPVDFASHLTLDRLLECIGRSGLLADSVMSDLRSPAYQAEEEIRTASDCAHHLWVTGALTGWQLHSLLQSRYKGFFLGDYKLLDRLDDGLANSGYLVEHVLLQRKAVVKLLPTAQADRKESFLRKAAARTRLKHASFVPVLDCRIQGTEQAIVYVVQEFAEGLTLWDLGKGPVRPTQRIAYQIAAQLASAMAHAHMLDYRFLNLSPKNIFLSPTGIARVLTLGMLAEEARELGSQSGLRSRFVAPELQHDAYDHRADLFSLGAILRYLLSAASDSDEESTDSFTVKLLMKSDPALRPENAQEALRMLSAQIR
jgi:serine/threonine protein kinase